MDSCEKQKKWLTPSRERWILLLVTALVILAGARFILSDPRTGENVHLAFMDDVTFRLPGCTFHEITGMPCPFCGITRSMILVSRGDIAGGFRSHPLGPVVLMVSIFIVLASPFALMRKSQDEETISHRKMNFSRILTYAVFVVIVLAWIISLLRHFGCISW